MLATFVITLREGFEAALLLGIVYACLDRFGARAHYRWVTLGGALGLVASILMGIAVTFLSGPLLDLGAGLFSTGLGKLQGLGVLPATDALWDTSALLSDHSVLGGFLSGLVGYRARPSLLEVAAYVAYVAVAGTLFFGVAGPTPDHPLRAAGAESGIDEPEP